MCFDVKNECINNKFKKCNMRGFFGSRTQNESIFWEFFLDVIFKNTSNANILDFFIGNQ
jgi:hypothetical protein